MRTRRSDSFTTITVAGQVLPADLLQRIADKDKELGGLGADSYHLSPNETISEATNRAWNKLVAAWANFKSARQKLPANDPGTTVTRERWLLPLFQELCYGRLPASRSAVEIDGKGYAISHWWSSVPIHLVGVGLSIDKLSAGIAGAARSSPHSLVQELLNRSEESLWGFVSNGSQLRILRDNQNLVRQAYVEFDLEAMMDGEAYSDFVMLWLLCHQSRVEAEKPTDYWLEKWSRAAQERGVRALEHLREGVEEAISLFGSGFLAHKANSNLKEKLRSGLLNKQDYYRQLLRLVYRLLFLFVAEDRTDEKNRSLLFDPLATPEACERYIKFYSTNKLRRLAKRRHGSRHSDLYVGLRLVMQKLGSDSGCDELGVPALGSFLFSKDAISDLDDCEIANHDLLDAIRALAFAMDNQARRQIDYKNLGSEELGSVYESLLELHPEINADGAAFSLSSAVGHERKTTGSYYTPDSLVQCLLDSALDPVLNQRQSNYAKLGFKTAADAILDLKVCDPACGSGHFLIAAAHRIAYRLASARTGDADPSPDAVRHALRDVVGRCIYGVDINPMAVELCKVSLWMEAVQPGKPLSFLDHHILCGNSLLGATPALIKKGIPDEAFKPIEGDDTEYSREHKRRNRDERRGHRYLPDVEHEPWQQLGNLATSLKCIDEIADDTIEGVNQRQERYEKLVNSSDYRYGGLLADAWCSAFVWQKRKSDELPYPITEEEFRRIEENPFNTPKWMEREITRLSAQYHFFHWHLAFPGVFHVSGTSEEPENEQTGWSGGFHLVLGNPPWDKVQPEEQKFFATVRPDIALAKTATLRKRLIEELAESDPYVHQLWMNHKRLIEGTSNLIKQSGFYTFTSSGNLNTYLLFSELACIIINASGQAGVIVQSGIATDESGKELFSALLSRGSLKRLLDFENRKNFFPEIDSRFRFSLITISGAKLSIPNTQCEFGWMLGGIDELEEGGRLIHLNRDDLYLFNPTTGTSPIFVSQRDVNISKALYRAAQYIYVSPNDRFGKIDFQGELFNLTRDSRFFIPIDSIEKRNQYLPLYEAKCIHQFDHRYASFVGSNYVESPSTLKDDPLYFMRPKSLVKEVEVRKRAIKQGLNYGWMCGFRDISRSNNERTAIFSVMPFAAIGNSINLLLNLEASEAALLTANCNSYIFDYACRQKISGMHVNIWIAKQLPVIPLRNYSEHFGWHSTDLARWITNRVIELIYTAYDLASFARDCGYTNAPFRWDEDRRFMLRCELDSAYLHLYGIARDDIDYIMQTFHIIKRKDEQQYGEYRTKRVIVEIYDEMAHSLITGQPYQTRLNPPPGDPAAAHSPVQPLPLVLPLTARFPQPDHGVYMMRVVLSMLQESGGSIDMERLMNACRLLAMPDTLENYGARIEPDLARKWRRRFSDQFRPDLFLLKIDDLVQRGEIRLTREGTRFKVARIGTAVLPADAHIDFDARFALRINDSIPQAEKDAFTPLATHDQIEERTRAA